MTDRDDVHGGRHATSEEVEAISGEFADMRHASATDDVSEETYADMQRRAREAATHAAAVDTHAVEELPERVAAAGRIVIREPGRVGYDARVR